jgi:hypothetical protein
MAKPLAGPPKCASSSRLEQPEDSEAIRRYKLAREATRPRLAPSARARPLSPAQVRAHIDLTSATERLESFNRAPVKLRDLQQEPERLKEFQRLVTFFDRAVLTAARRGLASDPRVADRLRTLRAVGDWETLRQGRIGLEKGVRRPLSAQDPNSEKDLNLFRKINDLVASGQYSNWEEIRRALTRMKIIPRMSRVAFLKLRGRLGFPGRLPKP